MTTTAAHRTKFAWFDARTVAPEMLGHLLPSLHRHGYTAVVLTPDQTSATETPLAKVGLVGDGARDQGAFDVLLGEADDLAGLSAPVEVALRAHVTDADSLERACGRLGEVDYLVISFEDDTKIPLEIVLAHAEKTKARVVTEVADGTDAEVVLAVLEAGSDGILVRDAEMQDAILAGDAVIGRSRSLHVDLLAAEVTECRHVGTGERVCIDTCSYLGLDEGLLVGSFARGGLLVCSETHPLPYMPTRPFRVNAGSLSSYVLGPGGRTWYLSDLRAGHELLAVSTDGSARTVVVGRAKIERRPLFQITVRTEAGTDFSLIVQEDWHVRVFGAAGEVRNVTTLAPGDQLLGHLTDPARHVGMPVTEWIVEQ